MLNVQFSTFNAVDPRYPCFRSPPRISHCFETVVTGREGVVPLNLLFRHNAMVQPLHACHSFREELLARILGFRENIPRSLPNQKTRTRTLTLRNRRVPIQLSILRRNWSLVTLTLSFYMCHWCQYRCLVPNLHFNQCWYARLPMTSRNCCRTRLLTTCMGPPLSKLLTFRSNDWANLVTTGK